MLSVRLLLPLLLSLSGIQAKSTLRVFQTLPAEPSEMDTMELMRSIRATQARVFGDDGASFCFVVWIET